ncbi:hypothetical protein L3476_29050 [Paenibacillus thiaminolyticus]|uniref:hypothetical protein n=1 Tax=Paenibacillus thiaminolyticus TaxID=49283 RepID=UPI0011643B7A|nr:hypothetical protein [Paenibacillus thiaminolyticus]NGP57656.1 hypothetical protein [Paenibacillus thiaminolyticus]WCR27166.1 hypothetical protein L3476_29050 [Paenibacillus thiaminolyticus]
MGIPATTGTLRDKISEMEVGDYILGSYTNSTSFYIGSDQGTAETPFTGNTGDITGYWYYIKADKGLLISDRVVWHTVAWDNLNTNKLIQGRPLTAKDGTQGYIRSLTGGVAYANAKKNVTLDARLSTGKCFPTNNEYDKYLMGFPKELIPGGYTLDDVFHHKNLFTWTQDTTLTGTRISDSGTTESQDNTWRVLRGNEYNFPIWRGLGMGKSSLAYASTGFRPVFEYKEV